MGNLGKDGGAVNDTVVGGCGTAATKIVRLSETQDFSDGSKWTQNF